MASLSACLYLYLSVRLPICLSLCLCLCLCLPVPPASTLVSAGPESRVTCMTGNVASVLCMYECAFVCVRPWRTQTSCVSLYTRKPRTAYNYTARTHARTHASLVCAASNYPCISRTTCSAVTHELGMMQIDLPRGRSWSGIRARSQLLTLMCLMLVPKRSASTAMASLGSTS